MEMTDVRVKLIQDSGDRLKAVCSVTFEEEFVVRDVKVVEGTNGLFVAMPSRKLSIHCPKCRHKNHLRAQFCNECGAKLPPGRARPDANGRTRLHRDIAHPITPAFREKMQQHVIEAYEAEVGRSDEPGYEPVSIDDYGDDNQKVRPLDGSEYDEMIAELKGGSSRGGRSERSDNEKQRSSANARGNEREDSRSQGERFRTPTRRDNDDAKPTKIPEAKPVEVAGKIVDDDNGFGAGISNVDQGSERSTAPPAVVREAKAERVGVSKHADSSDAAPAPSPATTDDDGDGFGAGIL